MRPTIARLSILAAATVCLSAAHGGDVVDAAGEPRRPTDTSPSAYRNGPVDLRLGDGGVLHIPADCRVRCAGSSFAEVECEGARLEARSPAVLWPEPQHQERLPGGAVLQWAQYDGAFLGVLVGPNAQFVVLQQASSDTGRKWVLSLLRGVHTPRNEHSQVSCPAYIVLG